MTFVLSSNSGQLGKMTISSRKFKITYGFDPGRKMALLSCPIFVEIRHCSTFLVLGTLGGKRRFHHVTTKGLSTEQIVLAPALEADIPVFANMARMYSNRGIFVFPTFNRDDLNGIGKSPDLDLSEIMIMEMYAALCSIEAAGVAQISGNPFKSPFAHEFQSAQGNLEKRKKVEVKQEQESESAIEKSQQWYSEYMERF
jgi:hypothetical protein